MVASSTLTNILSKAAQLGASDVHIHAGAKLRIRVNGELLEKGDKPIPAQATTALIHSILNAEQMARLEQCGQVDLSLSVEGVGRCRCNAYRQQRGLDAVFRLISETPPSLSDLNLPAHLESLTEYRNGLVLVTGPAGSGKTSTIAALLSIINEKRRDHIITIEDPIEYLHPSKGCLVNQRQVGLHTGGFAPALRAALREDPDVMMIGELRDLDSISLAVTAAETGHLVFATLHTRSSIESINRLINVFPIEDQPQVRSQLSGTLRAVITQRLLMTTDRSQRIPALEILMVNPAVRGLILDNKTHLIISTQQLKRDGMCTLDQSLAELVRTRRVTSEEAARFVTEPQALMR
ncbi:MAG: hypothetical protein A2289_12960 [Deltaproteobacteria bacterium RIFOXYA12_FULL_58_15]|nr:MAG: hypothetical protein A2289_12960 [Deltaproteobacteria bacterium RIFOXYA12_FULL_58_15]OGR10158.1 MAG: hypothetical protein A2341_06205 [Deltaproteobacteria bacterium RIFOXYB12_FULL_58_9]